MAHRGHPGFSGHGMKGRQFRPLRAFPQPQLPGGITDAANSYGAS
ncbi:TPA: hypothetical protein ACGE8N_002164 [Yersinia enterocolitica]|nr:hypothetical protein [Yersinia enterocolitica]